MTHHFVGLSEVARAANRSLSTVNRNLSKLRDYGAYKDDEGVWHVPVTAIEGVGWTIKPDTSRHVSDDTPVTRTDMSGDMAQLREENADLRAKLARAEADADKWQALAAERLAHLDDMRRSQRLLEARDVSRESEPASSEQPAVSERTMQDESPAGRVAGWMRRRLR